MSELNIKNLKFQNLPEGRKRERTQTAPASTFFPSESTSSAKSSGKARGAPAKKIKLKTSVAAVKPVKSTRHVKVSANKQKRKKSVVQPKFSARACHSANKAPAINPTKMNAKQLHDHIKQEAKRLAENMLSAALQQDEPKAAKAVKGSAKKPVKSVEPVVKAKAKAASKPKAKAVKAAQPKGKAKSKSKATAAPVKAKDVAVAEPIPKKKKGGKLTLEEERNELEPLWGTNFSAARMKFKPKRGEKNLPRMLGPWCSNKGLEFKEKGLLTLPYSKENISVLQARLQSLTNWKLEYTEQYKGNDFDCGYGNFQVSRDDFRWLFLYTEKSR